LCPRTGRVQLAGRYANLLPVTSRRSCPHDPLASRVVVDASVADARLGASARF
jgi:hypothetical protein